MQSLLVSALAQNECVMQSPCCKSCKTVLRHHMQLLSRVDLPDYGQPEGPVGKPSQSQAECFCCKTWRMYHMQLPRPAHVACQLCMMALLCFTMSAALASKDNTSWNFCTGDVVCFFWCGRGQNVASLAYVVWCSRTVNCACCNCTSATIPGQHSTLV